MGDGAKYPFTEQGRRLRWLRQAERIRTGIEFAKLMKWGQPGYSQFETGARRIPANKVIELARKIPGFDPLWLWEGGKRGLSFDLRKRIEAEEAKEIAEDRPCE
jgi:transcriptional regulator with XRE-family HTH domain